MVDQETELKLLERTLIDKGPPVKLSYTALKLITEDFSKEIGRGGFGVVYLGTIGNEMIAVKKLLELTDPDSKQFSSEIDCLMRVKHKNIVRFLGYCSESKGEVMEFQGRYVVADKQQRFLCFEYVPNGSLDNYLQETIHENDWNTCYQIIKGICLGLQYLHENRINHLDLKLENVLLDAQKQPKITDFGLSRSFDDKQSRIVTQQIFGTIGCMPPEMIHDKEISFKSDIYSLGILLEKLWKGRIMHSKDNWLVHCLQMKRCIEIAQRCVDSDQSKRPPIVEIIDQLHEIESMSGKLTPFMNEGRKSTRSLTGQIREPVSRELIHVYPSKLCFPLEQSKRLSFSLKLTNMTDECVALIFLNSGKASYQGLGIRHLTPRMTVDIVAYIELEAVPETQRKENLLLISAVVSPDYEPYNLTSDTSRTETVVQEIELDVTFETLPQFQKLQLDADTGSGDAATTKMTQPAGSRELIHVHPRKLCFPLEQNSKMPFSLQVTNVTDKYVPFYLLSGDKKPNRCHRVLDTELLRPHTTMGLVAYLELEAIPDQNYQKKVRVLSYTMDENMRLDVTHEIELEVVFVAPIQIQKNLTLDGQNGSGDATIQGFIETELLNIGPMELRFPFEPNRWIKRSIQLRNMTDDDVTIWILPENRERYFVKGCNPSGTVLPQSSEPVTIFVGIKEEELPTKNTDNLIILMATTSSLGQLNLNGCRSIGAVYDEVFKAARETGGKAHMAYLRAVIYDPEEMKELIDVKPRNLCFPLELNKRMSFSIQLTNRTDYHVALMLVPGHKLARACRLPWDRVLLSPQMTVGLVAYMEVEAGDEAVEETIAVLSTIVSKDMQHKDICLNMFDKKPVVHQVVLEVTLIEPSQFDKLRFSEDIQTCPGSITTELLNIYPMDLRFPLESNTSIQGSIYLTNPTEGEITYWIVPYNSWRYVGSFAWWSATVPPKSFNSFMLPTMEGDKEPTPNSDMLTILMATSSSVCQLSLEDYPDSQALYKVVKEKGGKAHSILLRAALSDQHKLRPSVSRELIQVHPGQLCFPLEQKTKIAFSLQLTNRTDDLIAFMLLSPASETLTFVASMTGGYIGPQYTIGFIVYVEVQEHTVEYKRPKDILTVRSTIVNKGFDIKDLSMDLFNKQMYVQDIEVEVVLVDKGLSDTTYLAQPGYIKTELLEIYPLVLRFPFEREKTINRSIALTNKTDDDIFFVIFPGNPSLYQMENSKLEGFVSRDSTYAVIVKTNRKELPSPCRDCFRIVFWPAMSTNDLDPNQDLDLRQLLQMMDEKGYKYHTQYIDATMDDPILASTESAETTSTEKFGNLISIDVDPTKMRILMGHAQHVCIWKNTETQTYTLDKCMAFRDLSEVSARTYMRQIFFGRNAAYTVVKFVSRRERVLLGDSLGKIGVYTTALEWVKTLHAHSGSIRSLCVDPSHPYVLSSSDDHAIKLWDWNDDWLCKRKFEGHQNPVTQVVFNPKDSSTFISVSRPSSDRAGNVKIWSVHSSTTKAEFSGEFNIVDSNATVDDRLHMVTLVDGGSVEIWDLQTEKCVHTLENYWSNDTNVVVCHPTLPLIFTGTGTGNVCIWNLITYRLEHSCSDSLGEVIGFGFIDAPGYKRLLIGYAKGIKLLDIDLQSLAGQHRNYQT